MCACGSHRVCRDVRMRSGSSLKVSLCCFDVFLRFLWMVRIGSGVFPVIQETDYLNNGEYRIDKDAAPKMLQCLM